MAVRPAAIFALLALVALVWLMFEGRKFTFQSDEWDWLLHRRGHSLGVFLRPHNEHLSALPILAYKAFFQLFGAQSTFSFRLLDAVLVCISASLLFVHVERRLGGWTALAFGAVLLFLGPAWSDIVWGFQIGYLGSLAAGLGALLVLDRHNRSGDLLASVLLVISLCCSSVGLPILVAVALDLLLRQRTDSRGRLWIVAVPAALYALWYLRYGVSSVKLSYLHFVPLYAFNGLAAVLGSLTGLTAPANGSPYAVSLDPGTSLAAILLLVICVQIARGRPLSPRFWAASLMAVAFWTAAALSYIPGREADQGRYVLPVAPFVILAVADCFRGWRGTPRATVLILAAACAAIASNLGFLRQGVRLFDDTSQYARAELGAMEVARGVVSPTFQPESGAMSAVIGIHNMTPIDARSYFEAIDSFGSPADSVSEILATPESVREASDYVLAQAERLGQTSTLARPFRCVTSQRIAADRELRLDPGTFAVTSSSRNPAAVLLRRFAATDSFVRIGPISRGAATSLTIPRDRSSLPWYLRLAGSRSARICRVI